MKLKYLFLYLIFSSCNVSEHESLSVDYYSNGNKRVETYKVIKNEKVCECFYYESEVKKKEYCLNENNRVEGKLVEYFENGNIKSEINYINGVVEGELKRYHNSTELKSAFSYSNGIPYGVGTFYYKSGQIKAVNVSYEGNVVYVKSYSKGDSINYKEQLEPIVYFENDTIKIGDTLRLDFYYPDMDDIPYDNTDLEVYFNIMHSTEYTSLPRKPVFKHAFADQRGSYEYYLPKPGKYILLGYVASMNNPNIEENSYFEKLIYVIE